MSTRSLLRLSLASALLLSACTGAATPAPTAAPSATPAPVTPAPVTPAPPTAVPRPSTAGGDSGVVAGRTFISTGIDGHALAPDSKITISFDGDRISINAGCNSIGGQWRVTGGALSLGMLAMTEMACVEPLMTQDTWIAAFLDGATMTLDAETLTFAKAGVTLTMTDKQVVDPSRPLEGTTWVLDSILVGLDAVSSVPEGVTASLMIVDGRAQVAAGCNKGGASVEIAASELTFGPMALTKMACQPDAMGVEETVVGVLAGTVTYAIDGPTLTLTGAANGLIFRAAP